MHVTDWLPTLCEIAGREGSNGGGGGCSLKGKPLDGVSQWRVITSANASSRRTEIVHGERLEPVAPYNSNDTLTLTGALADIDLNTPYCNATALRQGDYKLVVDQPGARKGEGCAGSPGGACLFNVAQDEGETTDLSAEMPKLVAKMVARVAALRKTAVPHQDWLPPDPRSNPNLHGGVWTPWLE
jgi:arylsulfatase B/arylsulfatase I/J